LCKVKDYLLYTTGRAEDVLYATKRQNFDLLNIMLVQILGDHYYYHIGRKRDSILPHN